MCLLVPLNRELDANFQVDCFQHQAFYNRDLDRIEMHLASDREQVIRIAGELIPFKARETIHAENSHKYSNPGFIGSRYAPVSTLLKSGPTRMIYSASIIYKLKANELAPIRNFLESAE